MKNTTKTQQDLLHDFQSDLHAILSTVEQVRQNLKQDQTYCETVIDLASKRSDQLLQKWEQLKACIKEGEK